jgi:adenine deaminase
MATLNAAECLHVDDDCGSVSPGKRADILLVGDLAAFDVATVIAGGRVVARDGAVSAVLPAAEFPQWAYGTVRIPRLVQADDFVLASPGAAGERLVRVIDASGTTLVTGEVHIHVRVSGGRIVADPSRDLAKIAAVERVRGTGEIGVGLIRGFGLRRGAIATTYNSQQQNVVVLGIDESDMAVAVNTLARSGGGFVVVADGTVRALLALPLFGLESDQPVDHVVRQMRELHEAVRALGCALPAPFHTLGFMGLPVDIGTLKISPQGLVDVWKGEVVRLEV